MSAGAVSRRRLLTGGGLAAVLAGAGSFPASADVAASSTAAVEVMTAPRHILVDTREWSVVPHAGNRWAYVAGFVPISAQPGQQSHPVPGWQRSKVIRAELNVTAIWLDERNADGAFIKLGRERDEVLDPKGGVCNWGTRVSAPSTVTLEWSSPVDVLWFAVHPIGRVGCRAHVVIEVSKVWAWS